MFDDDLRGAIERLGRTVRALEPERLDGADAARLVELFTQAERLSAAGRLLAARQVERANAWQSSGHRSAAHWLAQATGTSVSQAVSDLETARRLDAAPATDAALRAGQLSTGQAREIAAAAVADPRAERELLAAARTDGMVGLRDRCRAVRAAAASEEEELARIERIRRERYFRHWTDHDGAARGEYKLTPEDGARVATRVEAYVGRIMREARERGRAEPIEAYHADALVAMAEDTGDPGSKSPKSMIHVRVDATALLDGETKPGETCEIPGFGPVPVATARSMLGDALLRIVITKGVDVTTIVHAGRVSSSRVRAAADEQYTECAAVGCHTQRGLEYDHVVPIFAGGETSLENTAKPCRWHHYARHHLGWHYVRGPDGRWCLVPPETTRGRREPAFAA